MNIRRFSGDSFTARSSAWVVLTFLGFGTAGCSDPVKVDVADGSSNFLNQGTTGLVDETSAAASDSLSGAACVTETSAAEQRQVAINVMLDSSGSMEEATGTIRTKWDSIQRAIRGFLVETRDSDLLMGLQFFPLLKPGSKFICETHDDCGPDGGPCFLSTCLQGETITLCRTNADCPGSPNQNPCVDFGLCRDSDPNAPLACVLGTVCGDGLGACDDFERTCTNATQCDPAFYATPAVEIGPISERLVAIDQALTRQPPQGLTPTAPALQGALAHAREWAAAHPDQTVATVLATDGLPTECGDTQGEPNDARALQQVLDIAATGLQGELPIRTFVIGVFPPGDGTSLNNVNAIAQAGGTEKAVFIDAGGEVEQQFLDALRAIRSGQLACEFKIPDSDQLLDYFRVNLQFDDGSTERQLAFVRDTAGCAANPEGWHYDVDPAQGTPSAIEVCPAVCEQFKAASTGSIRLQLGCATILR